MPLANRFETPKEKKPHGVDKCSIYFKITQNIRIYCTINKKYEAERNNNATKTFLILN